ncbi:MAG: insulinase family protein [Caldilineaceae bacterium SB0662_bin_9]|uniref:Insulinase family protein n=1 Tax=Caldilineaceae bacterium SB0662_bin_9 TaxID=2605258 RepID=A0A6B1DVP3_9CHLR|nr:insulinase family protein [Caldilineaceae bacterium SB0662_bin_9]
MRPIDHYMSFKMPRASLHKRFTVPKAILPVCLVVLLGLAIYASNARVGSADNELQNRVQVSVLDNGVQVVLAPAVGSGLSTVNVWIKAGAAQDPPDRPGLAHYYEHMVFKGSEQYPGPASDWIESRGGYANASTSHDYTEYYIEVPLEHTELAVNLLADMVTRREFSTLDLENERNVVLREWDMVQDDPRIGSQVNTRGDVLGDGPFGRPILGTPESIETITASDLVRWSEMFYVPENMIVVVVSDLDQNHLQDLVAASFGPIEPRPAPPLPSFVTALPSPQQLHQLENHGQLDRLAFAWALPPAKDLNELAAREVLSYLLPLEIYTEEGVDSVDYQTAFSPNYILVEVEFPQHIEAYDMRDNVLATLEDMQWGYLDREYVALAKRRLTQDLLSTRRWTVTFADQLGLFAAVTGDPLNAFTYIDHVARVDKSDLVALARRYLAIEQRVEYWMVADDDAAIDNIQYDSYSAWEYRWPEYQILSWDDIEFVMQEVGIRFTSGFMQWAARARSLPWPVPVAKTTVDNQDGYFILDNGARILLMPDPSTDFVEVFVLIGGGNEGDSGGQAGLASFTGELLLHPLEYGRFRQLDAWTEVWPQFDEMILVLNATSASWPSALPPFLSHIASPEWDGWYLDDLRIWVNDEIRARDEDPYFAGELQLRESLYGVGGYGNPGTGTIESVASFDLRDVTDIHERFYVADNLVLVAAGNFNARTMLAALTRSLGRLPSSTVRHGPDAGDIVSEASRTASTDWEGIQLAWIMVGFPGPGLTSVDYPTFRVLNSILGSGSSSRLSTYFREQEGDVYIASSFVLGLKHGSYMNLYAQVKPEDTGKFVGYTLSEVQSIAESGISQEELQEAIARELGDQLRQMEWIGDTAVLRGMDILHGFRQSGDDELLRRIERVSVDDVRTAAAQVLEHYVVSEVVPTGQNPSSSDR